jgi:Cu2+-exporting ATPase/Cu+-exporting ATPase
MVAQPSNLHTAAEIAPLSGAPDTTMEVQPTCALCGLPVSRRILETFQGQVLTFCCYGCRHIYEVVGPELAQGIPLAEAMGRVGLDLNAPCCRGAIHGAPAEVANNILSKLMLNAFLSMMVMVLSLALYSDFFFADWGPSGQSVRSLLQLTTMLFATPAVLLLALPILEDALFTFRVYRQLTTSALIAAGSLAAYGLSVYATFTGQGHTYFETATTILLLVTLGRWLDAKTQVDGNQALEALLARTPLKASLIMPNGSESLVPVEQLQVGDQIRVRPGENIAVDGRIVSGEGSVNEANITGEATPVYKGLGHSVYAGTTNLDGSMIIEATQVGEERVMGRLVRLLDEARLYRAPIERLADRVAAYFVPVVIVLAAVSFLFWTWSDGFERGLLISLAVLLIACPCALGIATPLAIWAALGRAAQAGILIRDSLTLEKLSHVRHIFFDKTGTLTTGQPSLVELVTESEPASAILHIAASLEHHSEHPLARAIETAATEQGALLLPVENFQAIPGQGVKGQVNGREIFVGSWRLVKQQNLALPVALHLERQRLEQAGLTVVHIGWAGQVQGLAGLAETIRPAAAQVLAELQAQKFDVQVLTGDSAAAGAALGRRLGVPVQSQLLPHDKVKFIEKAEVSGRVTMIGDGLNDAPALARAGVGIALGCGADVTREAADVSLLGSDLAQISWVIDLARRTYRTIGWNLAWAFIYNLVGVALAMAGFLHPVLAAVVMVISSALVVGNSLRIFKYKKGF